MKMLTLHQPWASLVALGVKTIETRSWSTRYRGPLAIHAAAHYPDDGPYPNPGYWEVSAPCGTPELVEYGADAERTWINRHRLWLGAIVATCTLVDVVPILNVSKIIESRATKAVSVLGDAVSLYDNSKFRMVTDITAQRPYGDFRPGRYAWLLTDIAPLPEPVPFKGGQGLSRTWDGRTWDEMPEARR